MAEEAAGAISDQPGRVLVLSYSELAMDARVLRQVRWLKTRYRVVSAAFGASPVDGVEHVTLEDLPPYTPGLRHRLKYIAQFILGRFAKLSEANPRDRAAAAQLVGEEWDAIIANDTSSLPLASRLRSRHGILADLHEYAPRQGEESLVFRLTEARHARWILRRYLPSAAAVTTVSQGIAEEYSREFGVLPGVVANAAAFRDAQPRPVGSPIRIVHSAAPNPARRIEVMIEAFRDTTADVTFDLYLVDDGSGYVSRLRRLADEIDRVRILPPIPNAQLVDTLAGYDLGVHLLPPINFNHRWALPNKLFDYVQARLGLLVGPSPEMQRLVETHGLGAVTEGFTAEALTRSLNRIDAAAVTRWKQGSHLAARELSGEHGLEHFERTLRGMIASPE